MEPHSSTSSSEQTAPPPTARLAVLAWAVAGALVLLALWEVTLHQMGAVPGAAMRPGRQAAELFLAPVEAGRRRLVMFGSSRVENGFAPSVVKQHLDTDFDVRNCSMAMGSSAQMLEIAKHELRPGDVVICEVWPIGFYEDRSAPDMPEFANHFGAAWALSRLERAWADALADNLLAFSSNGDPVDRLRLTLRAGLVGGNPEQLNPENARFIEHPDGWREAILADDDVENWRKHAAANAPKPSHLTPDQRLDRFEKMLARLSPVVSDLENSGVTVLFLCMPSSGLYRAMEEATFPRNHYWDRLEHTFPGRCLHFADDPVMRELWTPDESHLETKGARVFSGRVAWWVNQKAGGLSPAADP